MKYSFLFSYAFQILFVWVISPVKDTTVRCKEENKKEWSITQQKMKITIADKTFMATLHDNATAEVFTKVLPLSLDMIELNGNEKHGDLSKRLPTNASNPGLIKAGDIMLYGSSTIVIFYKSFSTSYSYTKLGKVDDVEGLTKSLGEGNVSVKFELKSVNNNK